MSVQVQGHELVIMCKLGSWPGQWLRLCSFLTGSPTNKDIPGTPLQISAKIKTLSVTLGILVIDIYLNLIFGTTLFQFRDRFVIYCKTELNGLRLKEFFIRFILFVCTFLKVNIWIGWLNYMQQKSNLMRASKSWLAEFLQKIIINWNLWFKNSTI